MLILTVAVFLFLHYVFRVLCECVPCSLLSAVSSFLLFLGQKLQSEKKSLKANHLLVWDLQRVKARLLFPTQCRFQRSEYWPLFDTDAALTSLLSVWGQIMYNLTRCDTATCFEAISGNIWWSLLFNWSLKPHTHNQLILLHKNTTAAWLSQHNKLTLAYKQFCSLDKTFHCGSSLMLRFVRLCTTRRWNRLHKPQY